MITTGPGLIRPIATASTNCFSVSQWWFSTSPECRYGTIARPEPKVKAPAARKNSARAPNGAPGTASVNPLAPLATTGSGPNELARSRWGSPPPHQIDPKRPASKTSQTISAPASAVAAQSTIAIAQATRSDLLVLRASFTAAMAMIASTAGPTPRKMLWTTLRPWYFE